MDALKIGLEEIPAESITAREIRWAFDKLPSVSNYADAYALVGERYPEYLEVACDSEQRLDGMGMWLNGGDDCTKVIGETVSMGHDNDCTGATAGSIFGAVYGASAIPEHWTQ